MCALEEEVNALCNAFGIEKEKCVRIGSSVRCWSTYCEGKHLRIVDLDDEQGVLSASVVASEVILSWKPWCIVSFGIAGRTRTDNEDIGLEDVIIGDSIVYYEPGKEFINESGQSTTNRGIRAFNTQSNAFSDAIEVAKKRLGNKPRIRVAQIFSGEKKIADPGGPVRELLKTAARETFAIEMEAAGVAQAAKRFTRLRSIKFLAIKGLSDDAGIEEGVRNTSITATNDRLQRRSRAAENAAKCLSLIVRHSTITLEIPAQVNEPLPAELWNRARAISDSLSKFVDFKKLRDRKDKQPLKEQVSLRVFDLLRRSRSIPPLYMHWRVRPEHRTMHWLDLYFLLALEPLTKSIPDLPIHILLTDVSGVTDAHRKRVEAVVRAVLGPTTLISWLSEVQRNFAAIINAYIGRYEIAPSLYANADREKVGKGVFAEELWMRYIVWATQNTRSCFVTTWIKAAPVWKKLLKLRDRDVMLLPRKSLTLGGKLGKTEAPGSEIVFNPPSHPELKRFLRRAKLDVVAELAKHFGYVRTSGWTKPAEGAPPVLDKKLFNALLSKKKWAGIFLLESARKWNASIFR